MANQRFLLLILLLPLFTQSTLVSYLPGYPGPLPFKLETGYIGVGKSVQQQLFYYFVESERNVEEDPLFIWLTGGPGCSAFTALVYEIGPLSFNYSAYTSESKIPPLQLNPYSWTKLASIIFLDSPVGTGFSYTTNPEEYYSDDNLQSTYIYEFIRKWFINHPKFIKHPFYITGDSYSGKIIPLVANKIFNGNDAKLSPEINLKGFILGNPTTNEDTLNSRVKYAHRVSLLSEELYEDVKSSCKGDYTHIDASNTKCSLTFRTVSQDMMRRVNTPYILEPMCIYLSPKPINKISARRFTKEIPINSLRVGRWCRHQNYLPAYKWANEKSVQRALNIREGTIDNWVRCNKSILYSEDAAPSSFGYHQNLTKRVIRGLIYSGDQDMVVPYVDTVQWIKKLNVPIDVKWRPWFLDGQVAGYATDYSNNHYRLTYTTIKGGGHTAPEFKPRECFSMVDRWLALRYL